MIKRCIAGLAAAALTLGGVGQAGAGVIQLTDPSMLNAGDSTAVYSGVDGDHLSSPVTASAGGNTLTFSDDPTVGFLRVDQGNSWGGAFPNGTKLLWGIDAAGGFKYGGPDTIAFGTSVTEAGLSVQQDQPDNTTFTAQVFTATGSQTFTVSVPAGTGSGNLGFLGFKATGGDVITQIVISSADAVASKYNNDFAFGPVTFGTNPDVTPVPEPSTIMMAGLGVVALVAFGRRRLARKAD